MISLFFAISLLLRRCVALCVSVATDGALPRIVERIREVVRPNAESRIVQAPQGVSCRGGFVEGGSPPRATGARETPLRTFAGTWPSTRCSRFGGVTIDLVRHRRLAPLFVRLSFPRSPYDVRSAFGTDSVGGFAIAFAQAG
jgi:hypothetical protein